MKLIAWPIRYCACRSLPSPKLEESLLGVSVVDKMGEPSMAAKQTKS